MNNLAFEASRFNYFLHKLAENPQNVSIDHDNLIITKKSDSSLEEKVKGVVNYIISNHSTLNNNQIKLIKSIQQNFYEISKGQGQEIQKAITPLLSKLDDLLQATSEVSGIATTPQPIALQIAPAPTNLQEFEANLQKVIENFPRYQLHNDLSVFDSTFQSLPADWNFDLMHRNLLLEFKKYEQSCDLTALKSEILSIVKIPTPVQMGIIIETSPANTDNTVLLSEFANLIHKNIPCIVNRQFFQAHDNNLTRYTKLNLERDTDIYIQKDGGLCVIIPKGKSLTELGFNPESMEKSTGQHLLTPSSQLLDFSSLLVNENEKQRFFRLVSFSGHGGYPGFPNELSPDKPGVVGGLESKQFQYALDQLKDKNTAFMILMSCYSGGTISADLHLSDSTLPFPIYVNSAFDLEVLDYERRIDAIEWRSPENTYDTSRMLAAVQKRMFPNLQPDIPMQNFPKPLTPKDRQALSGAMDYPDMPRQFRNLGTFLLPVNQSDIPRVAYAIPHSDAVLDVTQAHQKERSSLKTTLENRRSLVDSNPDRKGYLFTDQIVPFSLTVSGNYPMILLSRGGTYHHAIQEISDANHNIEDIAKATFNAFNQPFKKMGEQEANKVFFIGQLQCQYQGNQVTLKRIMIKNTPKAREVLFQIDGEQEFRKLIFKEGNSLISPWELSETQTVELDEALKDIYLSADASTPSAKALLQTTAGKQSTADFIEALDSFFFADQIPDQAKLYSAIIQDKDRTPDLAFRLKQALRDLQQKMSGASHEEFLDILSDAIDVADSVDTDFWETIREASYTPLMQAIKEKNLQSCQAIINDHPEMLEEEDVLGSTALYHAMEEKQFEIAKMLIEKGADLNHKNHDNYTPFSACCEKAEPEFLEWVLKTQGEFKGETGAIALEDALTGKKWNTVRMLLKHDVGSEADPTYFPWLNYAAEYGVEKDIIEKILQYPGVDVNQVNDANRNTPLHFSVFNCEIESLKCLLERGADPNQSNDKINTPLHCTAMYGKEKGVELVKNLLEAGAKIDSQNEQGETPLHLAIQYQDKALIEFLIKKGASLQIETNKMLNALENAAETPELLEFILQIPGQDINPKTCKLDKLFKNAIMKGDINLAKLLLNHSVDINQHFVDDKYGDKKPPLLYFLQEKPKDMNPIPVIDFFLDYGADLTQQDPDDGRTVMHWAVENQDVEVFKRFKEAKIPYDKPIMKHPRYRVTPFMLGFVGRTQNSEILVKEEFLSELLKDKELVRKNLTHIVDKIGYPWTIKNPGAMRIFFKGIMETLMESEASYKTDPLMLFYQELINTSFAMADSQSDLLDRQVDKLKQVIQSWKQFPNAQNSPFNIPILHTMLFLGLDTHEKTHELIHFLMDKCPDCLAEHYDKTPDTVTSDLSVLKTLIKRGAEINKNFSHLPDFDLETLQLLETKGLDLSQIYGLYYLENFLSKKYTHADQREGILYLLSKIQFSPHAALSYAIFTQAKAEYVDLLIDHPSLEADGYDWQIGSPLFCALTMKNIPVIKRLLAKDAVYKPNNNIKDTALDNPLTYLISLADPGDESDDIVEIVKLLIDAGYKTDLNPTDAKISSPLIMAIRMNQPRLVEYLVEQGADVNSNNGVTPLQLAIGTRHLKQAEFLINKGADINHVDINGESALYDTVRLALDISEDQLLPLISQLIQKGAKWDIPNKDGVTAKDLAIKMRLSKVFQLM